ncbi:MAG: nucleotide exchange factor GrpE [Chloroflexi bacterium]|nr:nucleotide exchange factor GrpE [Chloroflexota bacterium]
MKNKKNTPVTPDQEEMESGSPEELIQELGSDPLESEGGVVMEDQASEHGISLEDQIESLETSLEEAVNKIDEYLDGWQRARAEFANYKKRVLRENMDIRQVARGVVIKLYLDIADDLARALQDRPQNGDGEIWANGIEIIYQKLQTRLETEGIKPMNPLGQEFDPNIHEALMKEESDEFESGQIIEVMQEGYWIGEKVLRPALVRVAA